jgi:hypothetical protein
VVQAPDYFLGPLGGAYVFPFVVVTLALVGLAGYIAWVRSSRHWQSLVVGAAAAYLIAYALRFFFALAAPWFETKPPLEALWYPFYVVWSLISYAIGRGDFLLALGVTYFEWLMPLLQILVLVAAPRPALGHATPPA